MRDELRDCLCGRPHPWGILRYSDDNTPLYGPRSIPTCDHFRPLPEEPLPARIDPQELWSQTSDLDPQATTATRAVVARIRNMATGVGKYQRMQEQWPEFMGFVISQITNIRGAMVRDESKFAHLVAHTDEIVEAMRGVAQLTEKLSKQGSMLIDIMEQLQELKEDRGIKYSGEIDALEHFGLMLTDKIWDPNTAVGTERLVSLEEYRQALQANGSPTDAILTEAEMLGDDDE